MNVLIVEQRYGDIKRHCKGKCEELTNVTTNMDSLDLKQ